uniref:Uncharacterized protein n=1 Tax=Corethron hystrix TaxID=216773 RepID=A0A7S1B695_9STRA|mmetsp:Transcript_14643/g.32314  ORF Transcript_14643/g.32314 Transcript_14643/m.32314 type:complete len:535 (+) Transcript_14643:380-1984(+)
MESDAKNRNPMKNSPENLVSFGCCIPRRRNFLFKNSRSEKTRIPSNLVNSYAKISSPSLNVPRNVTIDSSSITSLKTGDDTVSTNYFLPGTHELSTRNNSRSVTSPSFQELSGTHFSEDTSSTEGKCRQSGTTLASISSKNPTSDGGSIQCKLNTVVILLVAPTLCRYQLVSVAYDTDTSTVGDIANLLTFQSPELELRQHEFNSLYRSSEDDTELLKKNLMKKYMVKKEEILVAVPKGWSSNVCCGYAKLLLELNEVEIYMNHLEKTVLEPEEGVVSIETNLQFDCIENPGELKPNCDAKPNTISGLVPWNVNTGVLREKVNDPKEVLIHHSGVFKFPSNALVPETISRQKVDEDNRKDLNDVTSYDSDDTASTLTMSSIDFTSKNDINVTICDELSSCSSFVSGLCENVLKIVVLVMEPITCHFELLLLEISDDTTVCGLIKEVKNAASKKLFENQNCVGLCRLDGRQMLNNVSLSVHDMDEGEVLVAVPEGLSALSSSLLAQSILRDPSMESIIVQLVNNMGRTNKKDNKK